MFHVLANEGGYQVFTLAGGDKFWLLFSGLTSLLAIGTVLEAEMPWRDRRPPVSA